jgi:hypothetical protein
MTIALGVHASAATTTPALVIVTPTRTSSASGSTYSVGVGWFTAAGAGVAPTVTDSKGNTYTQVGSTLQSGGTPNFRFAIFESVNGTGGTLHTCTATFLANQDVISIWWNEITGGLTSGIRDQAPGGNDDTASPYTSLTTGTTAQANELLIAYGGTLSASGTETITWGNSFTSTGDDRTNANAEVTGSAATRVVSATGAYQSSFTSAGAGTTEALVFIATYKDITAGGNPSTDQVPLQTALIAPGPKLSASRRVESVEPVGALITSPLTSVGWMVPESPPRPQRARRMAVSATAGVGMLGITLPWIDFAVRDPNQHTVVARAVVPVEPVGVRIAASALTSLGWLMPPQSRPLQLNPPTLQPSAPTSPLTPFVSPSFAWGASTDLPRDTPLVARQVSEVAPVGTLIQTLSSVG